MRSIKVNEVICRLNQYLNIGKQKCIAHYNAISYKLGWLGLYFAHPFWL